MCRAQSQFRSADLATQRLAHEAEPRVRSELLLQQIGAGGLRFEGDDPSPEQVYSDTHLDPDLQAALDELPPEFRAAVVLCDIEGFSYEEIRIRYGLARATVAG